MPCSLYAIGVENSSKSGLLSPEVLSRILSGKSACGNSVGSSVRKKAAASPNWIEELSHICVLLIRVTTTHVSSQSASVGSKISVGRPKQSEHLNRSLRLDMLGTIIMFVFEVNIHDWMVNEM